MRWTSRWSCLLVAPVALCILALGFSLPGCSPRQDKKTGKTTAKKTEAGKTDQKTAEAVKKTEAITDVPESPKKVEPPKKTEEPATPPEPDKTEPPAKTEEPPAKVEKPAKPEEPPAKTEEPSKKPEGAEPAAAPKVSTFAPADDLVYQVDKYISDLQKGTTDETEYKDLPENMVSGNSNTLILLALALGLHDQDNKYKANAVSIMDAAKKLAAANGYEATKKAVEGLAAAAKGEVKAQGDSKWGKVAEMAPLMKKVPNVNTALKGNLKRLSSRTKEAAGNSATLAVIAQGAMPNVVDTKKPEETQKWDQFCVMMRDAAAEVNKAVHAGDADAARAVVDGKLQKSCDDCHDVFHKEAREKDKGKSE